MQFQLGFCCLNCVNCISKYSFSSSQLVDLHLLSLLFSNMPTCPSCDRQVDPKTSIQCDRCGRTMHAACSGLPVDDAVRITRSAVRSCRFYCTQCASETDKFDAVLKRLDKLEQKLEIFNDKFMRIDELEKKLEVINNKLLSNATTNINEEELISEAMDRIERSRNIIVYNLPESNQDESEIKKVLGSVTDDPQVEHIVRLGQPIPAKNRPIKIVFGDKFAARKILKNKSKLKNTQFSNVRLMDDLSRKQLDYLKTLRLELKNRVDSGETWLTIKYIRNIPQIIDPRNN